MTITLVIARQLTKVLIFLGAIVMLRQITLVKSFYPEYVVLNLVGLSILVMFILLPVLSLYYNSFRFYMQILVISSVSVVMGANYALFFIPNWQTRLRLIAILLVVFVLSANGVMSYIVGGSAAMNLNNVGEEYDKFYTHESEVSSASWLAAYRNPHLPVYADPLAALRLISFGDGILETEINVLPSTLTRDSYVYLDYANLHVGIAFANYEGKQISYNYPLEFLDSNKNLIYDNGETRIFR